MFSMDTSFLNIISPTVLVWLWDVSPKHMELPHQPAVWYIFILFSNSIFITKSTTYILSVSTPENL